MATLNDLEEVKAALDKGLISQAEYDDVKREYLRAQKEILKRELEEKKEALVEFQKRELLAKEEFQQRKADAELREFALKAIIKHGASIMSEEQKADLVRDYAKMSGLDGSAEKDAPALKRQRVSAEKRDAAPPQTATPPAAAVPPPADAPAPVVANRATVPAPRRSKRVRSIAALVKEKEAEAAASEDGNHSTTCDGEDDSDSVEPRSGKRCYKYWTEDDDAALVAALRARQSAPSRSTLWSLRIGGRQAGAAYSRVKWARQNGTGSPVLREYLEETCPEYVYKTLSKEPWSKEEDETFIQAHREGKMIKEIAAMLPGRSRSALSGRWRTAKLGGKRSSAALIAYAAECCKA